MAEKVHEPVGGVSADLAVMVAVKIKRFRHLLLLAVVVAAAVAAIFSYRRHASAIREAEAENSVYLAEMDLMSKADTDVPAIFGQKARDFAGLPAGARALLIKFSHAFNTRNFMDAEQSARDFIRAFPKNSLLSRMRLALAQSLLMQDKLSESESLLRELARGANPEIFPEVKLALAQNLERQAEAAKDNPEEYRRRLEAAEEEYNDIVARSQITIPAQRGFWPQAVVYPAEFALVAVKDKLAGYRHPEPGAVAVPVTAAAADEATEKEEESAE